MSRVKPKMFGDVTPAQMKLKSQKLTSLKNLGPVMEKTLNKIGIHTVDQFKKIGWKEVILRLSKIHSRYCHTIYAHVFIGALRNLEWHKISEADKKAARIFIASLKNKKTSKKATRKTSRSA